MQTQAAFLAYIDVFFVLALLSLAAVPLALSLRPVPPAPRGLRRRTNRRCRNNAGCLPGVGAVDGSFLVSARLEGQRSHGLVPSIGLNPGGLRGPRPSRIIGLIVLSNDDDVLRRLGRIREA